MTDHELIARYVAGSPQAFAELVERHAAMVYSTCRRVTRDAEEAQDALQATFLVLARQARGLSGGRPLSGWLFNVARKVAINARRGAERRRRHEQEAAAMRPTGASAEARGDRWAEVAPQLDAALAALPAVQREVIVLRYLRGLPEAEVCRELGCPQSTVATRIARGLECLRHRLNRQGAALSTAGLTGLLANQAAPMVPPAAVMATLKGLGVGAASASAAATSLAEGTMKAMMWVKIKVAAAVLATATVVGGGGGALAMKLAAGEPAGTAATRPLDEVKPGQWMLVKGGIPLWKETAEGPNLGKSVDQVFGVSGSAEKGNSITAWCSALVDEKRGTYVALSTGGHACTRDNSSFAMDLIGLPALAGEAPPPAAGGPRAWSRLHNPSPIDQLKATPPPDFYPDGAPATTHSYGGIQHMLGPKGEIDRYWFCGGNKWPGDGPAFFGTGEFDPVTKRWSTSDQAFGRGGVMPNCNSLASAWDRFRLRVLCQSGNQLCAYYPLRPAGKRYESFGEVGYGFPGESDRFGTGFFDTDRHRFYVIGGQGAAGENGAGLACYQFDPKTGDIQKDPATGKTWRRPPIDYTKFPVLDIVNKGGWDYWRSPGGLYDELRHDIVIYVGGPVKGGGDSSNTLLRVNPDTWAVTVETSTGAPECNSVRTGTYGKFRHLVREDVYVHCRSMNEGVWAYRPLAKAEPKAGDR
jgi:RNA polymerase sigma factor (sigma-70 family)